TTYRPPAGLADFVRARDQHCIFPGCTRPATHCDIDHTTPHPHGPTAACNLACLCRRHHRLKHETDWTLQHDGDRYIWTTPTPNPHPNHPPPPPQPHHRQRQTNHPPTDQAIRNPCRQKTINPLTLARHRFDHDVWHSFRTATQAVRLLSRHGGSDAASAARV